MIKVDEKVKRGHQLMKIHGTALPVDNLSETDKEAVAAYFDFLQEGNDVQIIETGDTLPLVLGETIFDELKKLPVGAYLTRKRISRVELFMTMAQLIAQRGTCLRAQVGALLVLQNRPISMGYVGAPPHMDHCLDVGCDIGEDGGCRRTIHAETNALIHAARIGVATLGCEMYTTMAPCLRCSQNIIAAGVSVVHYAYPYRDPSGVDLLKSAQIDTHLTVV